MTLTEFLLARVAEDVAAVGSADLFRIYDDEQWNIVRVLAECSVKRQMVRMGDDRLNRMLALPHADHPDYDESWRP